MYILRREQHINSTLELAWDFLKNPTNLNLITPPDLQFDIISKVPEVIYNGLIIEYQITIPIIGKQRWVTEIKHIRENHSFVDEQRVGPYSFWYHYHQIGREGSRIKSIDEVHYVAPFGPLGKILHSLFIRKNLERIFDFRRKRLSDLLSIELS